MEMIDRYIYAVSKRLPASQRSDISQELRGLIEDMLEERTNGREATEKDVEEVLLELGNPNDLATQYGGSNQFLIGPKLFPTYISILKIVIYSVIGAMVVVFSVETITAPNDVLSNFIDLIINAIWGSLQAFAWVTIGFGVAEYYGKVPQELIKDVHDWSPRDLPPIPDPKTQIKRSDPISGIIFSIIALVVISFSNHLLGVLIFDNDQLVNVVSFFIYGYTDKLHAYHLFIGGSWYFKRNSKAHYW